MRIFDLSVPLGPDTMPYPGHPNLSYDVLQTWPKDRLNTYVYRTTMHIGTHVDAPFHMAPKGWRADEIPLDRLVGSAVVVDLRNHVDEWTLVTPEMVEAAAPDVIGPGDIVILLYGWHHYASGGNKADAERYYCLHPGPDVSLVDWLIERGIKWVGVDAPSFEHPFNINLKKTRPDLVRLYEARSGEAITERFPDEHWMYAHRKMGEHNIMHVDQLGGEIDQIAGQRIQVGAFPLRLVGGEGSLARVVAFGKAPNAGL